MVYRGRSSRWYLVGSEAVPFSPGGLWMVAVSSWWALDGSCYFLMGSGWLLILPGGPIPLFLVSSGWLLLFPGGTWMVTVIGRSVEKCGKTLGLVCNTLSASNLFVCELAQWGPHMLPQSHSSKPTKKSG